MKKASTLIVLAGLALSLSSCVIVEVTTPTISNVQAQSSFCVEGRTNFDFSFNIDGNVDSLEVAFARLKGETDSSATGPQDTTAYQEFVSYKPFQSSNLTKVTSTKWVGVAKLDVASGSPTSIQPQAIVPVTLGRLWVRGLSNGVAATTWIHATGLSTSSSAAGCDNTL